MPVCSKCKLEKDVSCFGKNKSKASGLNSYCKPCMASYHSENRERLAKRRKELYYANHMEHLAYKAEWRKTNREYMKTYLREYYAANKEKHNSMTKSWKKANPEKVSESGKRRYARVKAKQHAHVANYRARKLRATPGWSDKNFVDGMYSICGIMNAVRGAGTYSVDHIVPLRSKLVCGLHAHTNLTIMRTVDNKSKNNRHWPDMP